MSFISFIGDALSTAVDIVTDVVVPGPVGDVIDSVFDSAKDEVVNALDKDSSDYKKSATKDGKYWLNLQRKNPEEFRKQMDKLDAPDKQKAYTDIQNEIQSENRFWTMMTNTQQAEHDTTKAILNNFRV